jgi:ubiquinone/menaquinone biosynthesis C-methylase UbiE
MKVGKRRKIAVNMKEEWDRRARNNAFHYVSSFSKEWDDESFYRWGEIQTQIVIDEFFRRLNVNTSNLVMLEIGCGAGRMTRALASRFKIVFACDVSDEYVRIAREKNSNLKNVVFAVNDGSSFPRIGANSVDFVFSGWTMQHMPRKDVVIKNIEEMARVLKPGGYYKIDPILTRHTSFIETIISKLMSSETIRSWASLLGMDKQILSPTWRGARFTEKEIFEILSKNNLTVNVSIENDGYERFQGRKVMRKWFHGKKQDVYA